MKPIRRGITCRASTIRWPLFAHNRPSDLSDDRTVPEAKVANIVLCVNLWGNRLERFGISSLPATALPCRRPDEHGVAANGLRKIVFCGYQPNFDVNT